MPELVLDSHKKIMPIDHPDTSITRVKLAIENWFSIIEITGMIQLGSETSDNGVIAFPWQYLDGNVQDVSVSTSPYGNYSTVVARWLSVYYFYLSRIAIPESSADFDIRKVVGGTDTRLAYESVNLSNLVTYTRKFRVVGSTLQAFRTDMVTPKISATDTSISSAGYWGYRSRETPYVRMMTQYFSSPPVVPIKPVEYFEVPVSGSGTDDDPFTAVMPEDIAYDWSLNPQARKRYEVLKSRGFSDEEILTLAPEVMSCRVNRLALTHSSLIVTDTATGKPKDYVAVVRIFDQPDRQESLKPIDKAIQALRELSGVRKLDRDEAIRMAKRLDDRLTDVDLLPVDRSDKSLKQRIKDYVEHRKGLGVRDEHINDEVLNQYVVEDKGW